MHASRNFSTYCINWTEQIKWQKEVGKKLYDIDIHVTDDKTYSFHNVNFPFLWNTVSPVYSACAVYIYQMVQYFNYFISYQYFLDGVLLPTMKLLVFKGSSWKSWSWCFNVKSPKLCWSLWNRWITDEPDYKYLTNCGDHNSVLPLFHDITKKWEIQYQDV